MVPEVNKPFDFRMKGVRNKFTTEYIFMTAAQ